MNSLHKKNDSSSSNNLNSNSNNNSTNSKIKRYVINSESKVQGSVKNLIKIKYPTYFFIVTFSL